MEGFLCLGIGLFATLSSVEDHSIETTQVKYAQNPPIAKNYWVQKIRTPSGVQGGNYSVLLKAEFEHDLPLPDVLNIYKNGEIAQVMTDNGVFPDNRPNDGIFATIVNEDPDVFANEVLTRLNHIQTKGYAMDFVGHSGKILKYRDVTQFDLLSFTNFEMQSLDPVLIEGTTSCDMDENAILKQNSLLITDINVVEDPARTYNVVTGQGASQGAWTYGQLMKNMAGGFADESNPTPTEITVVRDFIKNWIIQFYTQYSINGRTSPTIAPKTVLRHLIKPWVYNAKESLGQTVPNISSYDMEDWKTYWDSFTTATELNALLKNAPFKLSAIVNRVDLRGNGGYGVSNPGFNAGETRFIFSLIQTLDNQGGDNNLGNLGKPPWHQDTGYGPNAGKKIDWRGMNIILEYANVASSSCDTKDIGQQWKDLSTHTVGSASYLTALQNITDLVTTRNANTEAVNGSAISQVRTNSKLFAIGNVSQTNRWDPTNWELREFGLDQNGNLVSQATGNMPFAGSNYNRNSGNEGLDYGPDQSSEPIADWIYGVNGSSHWVSVKNGNHNIPQYLLEPVSELKDELQSYYGLGFWHSSFPDNIFDDDNYSGGASSNEKEIRHQLSLNTCLGCHGGETKTMFSMIQPLGYGQEADYWSTVPATTSGDIDHGNQVSNAGFTLDPSHPDAVGGFIPNHEQEYYSGSTVHENRTIPLVSPFLTGRNFRGTALGLEPAWDDDKEDLNGIDENHFELGDKEITGFFYVNDPSNEADINHPAYEPPSYVNQDDPAFPQHHNKKYGYNELENRQMDLCLLTSTSCNAGGGVFSILAGLDFVPLPLHGH